MTNARNLCAAIALLLAGTVPVFSQADCWPAPSSLTAWWQAEGNALDSAGTNNASLAGNVSYTNAEVGLGFLLSGNGQDYVALPPNIFSFPSTGISNAPLSFEVWFQTTGVGVILGQQDQPPYSSSMKGWVPAVYVGLSGLVYGHLFEGAGSPPWISNSIPVNDGNLHHCAVTYDGTNEFLYVDGAMVASMPFTQKAYGSGNYQYQLGLGYTAGWPDTTGGWMPFAGVLDEASIYNRALSSNDVAAIYRAGSAGKCAVAPPSHPILLHRYSFNEPTSSLIVTDSVSGANGALEFAATSAPYTNGPSDGSGFNGQGQLALAGTNGFVALPQGLVSIRSAVTFEIWVTWNGPILLPWPRIFDFGASDAGLGQAGTGTNYIVLTPADNDYLLAFDTSTVNPAGEVADSNALALEGDSELGAGQPAFIAVTYDPPKGLAQLYVNGILVNSYQGPLDALRQFLDENNWLGRSQWAGDPFFAGSFEEFRIWWGVLSASQIESHRAAGPNQVLTLPTSQPWLNIAGSGANVVITWDTNVVSGFQLQTSPVLPATNWVTLTNTVSISNDCYSVTLPALSSRAWYRLKRP